MKQALAFWEAQGFRIALYRMRQYRDPQTGEAFIGALSSDFPQKLIKAIERIDY